MTNTSHAPMLPLRELLTFYFKNRQRLLIAFWAPFALAILISFIPAPRFHVSSVLTVRMGSEYVYQPEIGATQNAQPTIPFDRDQIFKSEVAILSSDDLHKAVIQKIGLANLYPTIAAEHEPEDVLLAEAVEKFDKRLDVSLEKESSVITVTFSHKNADLGVKTLDLLLKLYMDKRKELYIEPRVEMAKARADESHQHALAAEQLLEEFKHTHNILSFESERQALLQQRSDIQGQLGHIQSPGLQEKLDYFEKKINRLNEDEATFNALSHDVTVAHDEDAVFAHRLGDATAYEDLERDRVGSVRIIQPPMAPAEPKRWQLYIIAAGMILSALSFLITAIATNSFSSGFLTPERLGSAMGLPVLVVLPHRAAN